MISQNHNGVGNPNHDESTGQFTSTGAGSGGAKKTNIKKNGDYQGGITTDDVKFLKDHGIYDDYKKKQAEKITTQKYGGGHNIKVENLPNKKSLLKQNKDNFAFQDMMKELNNTALAKMIKFVWSGFDFNKLKSKGVKLNSRVFRKNNPTQETTPEQPPVPQKVTDDEMKQVHQEGLNLSREQQALNVELDQINNLKEIYKQKFGNRPKQYSRWLKKSNLFKRYLTAKDKEQELNMQKKALDEKEKSIRNRIFQRNQMVKKEG